MRAQNKCVGRSAPRRFARRAEQRVRARERWATPSAAESRACSSWCRLVDATSWIGANHEPQSEEEQQTENEDHVGPNRKEPRADCRAGGREPKHHHVARARQDGEPGAEPV